MDGKLEDLRDGKSIEIEVDGETITIYPEEVILTITPNMEAIRKEMLKSKQWQQ